MDDAYLARFLQRSEYEAGRTAPPEGFPQLPDLPLGRYTEPEFYEQEHAFLWRRSWLYACHVSQLGDPGGFKVIDVVGTSVLVVNGGDHTVRAFVNACRHRGAPVVRTDSGVARQFSCTYHSWTYDLSGALVRVPDQRDFVGLCNDERGLVPVRCERWGGWIFVNLDEGAEPLEQFLAPLTGHLTSIANADWQVLASKTDVIQCNWKVLAEGFLEVYHARTVHPTTIAPTLDTAGTVITLYDRGHQAMISPVNAGTRTDGRETLPMFPGAPAMFQANQNPAHGIFPNLITPLDARGFPFLVFWPDGVERTRLDITWFAPAWGDGPIPNDAIWEQRLSRFDRIMAEDYLNLEPIQRSMRTAAHGGQVINYQERRIWHVHAWIDKTIGAERIAPHLRVPDLLADWVEPTADLAEVGA
jgi:phenylpropionate dioxygenase-like ring-hydroxylating dioxygenase large terminal subunit